MLQRMLAPTEDEEFQPAYRGPGGSTDASVWRYALVVALLLPYILIFVLFGLYANIDQETNNYYTSAVSSSSFSQKLSASLIGKPVSLSANGSLQVGAGTSLYQNLLSPSAPCPAFVSLSAFADGLYLLSAADSAGSNATLQTLQVTSSTSGVSAATRSRVATSLFLFETVALSPATGLFVGICQDKSSTEETALVVAGRVDVSTGAISVAADAALPYASVYSLDPQLVALSETSFAIAYFDYTNRQVATRYGSVDPTTLALTLSTAVVFADNRDNSTYVSLAALSPTTYLLLYYDAYTSTAAGGAYGSGPLTAAVASVSGAGSGNASTASISVGAATALNSSAVSFFFASAGLDNATAVVVYADATDNYALWAQLVSVETLGDSAVVFGARLLLNSGQTFAALATGYPDVDVIKMTDAGSFLVLYGDLSNAGRLTLAVASRTAAGDLVPAAPNLVLSTQNPDVNVFRSWGALAAGATADLHSEAAIAVFVTDSSQCLHTPAISSFSVLQQLPNPVGVVVPARAVSASASTSAAPTVAVAGTVSSRVFSALQPGKLYYATTTGQFVVGSQFYGAQSYCTASSTSATECSGYVYDADSGIIVLASAQVGLALGAQDLLLLPRNLGYADN